MKNIRIINIDKDALESATLRIQVMKEEVQSYTPETKYERLALVLSSLNDKTFEAYGLNFCPRFTPTSWNISEGDGIIFELFEDRIFIVCKRISAPDFSVGEKFDSLIVSEMANEKSDVEIVTIDFGCEEYEVPNDYMEMSLKFLTTKFDLGLSLVVSGELSSDDSDLHDVIGVVEQILETIKTKKVNYYELLPFDASKSPFSSLVFPAENKSELLDAVRTNGLLIGKLIVYTSRS